VLPVIRGSSALFSWSKDEYNEFNSDEEVEEEVFCQGVILKRSCKYNETSLNSLITDGTKGFSERNKRKLPENMQE